MIEQEALQFLVNGVEVAQKRGAFDLKEAALLSKAVEFFTTPASETSTEPTEEVETGSKRAQRHTE